MTMADILTGNRVLTLLAVAVGDDPGGSEKPPSGALGVAAGQVATNLDGNMNMHVGWRSCSAGHCRAHAIAQMRTESKVGW